MTEFLEFINGLLAYSTWEKFANLHGIFATLGLILFGVALALTPFYSKAKKYLSWFRTAVTLLLLDIFLLTLNGFLIYQPYRAGLPISPRSIILASDRPWLHQIVFEHKEFLAFAPLLLVGVAVFMAWYFGGSIKGSRFDGFRKVIFWSLLLGLIFTFVIAGEAVLVTKFAPVS